MQASTFTVLVALVVILISTAESRTLHNTSVKTPAPSDESVRKYMSYSEVAGYLRALQKRYPNHVHVGHFGRSVEGRELLYIRVSGGGKTANNVMLVDALMHAREWITLPVILYFLEKAVQDPSVMNGVDLVAVPVVNPDGYEYSRTKDRMWRKNRHHLNGEKCIGVDINRNFDFHWSDFVMMGQGASDDACAEDYAGGAAASEPETQSYQKFIHSLNKNKQLKMYLNMHSMSQKILGPWGYTPEDPQVPDHQEIETIEREANAAMVRAGSTSFSIQTSASDYVATGSAADWVRGMAGVKKSFIVELPPGRDDKKYKGFHVRIEDVPHITRQVFEGLKVFAKYAKAPPKARV